MCSDIAGILELEACSRKKPSKYKTSYVIRLKPSKLNSHTNNLLPGIVECVLCCTTVDMVIGSSRRKGMVIGARSIHEEFCMETMDMMGAVIGPLTLSVERPSCHYLS